MSAQSDLRWRCAGVPRERSHSLGSAFQPATNGFMGSWVHVFPASPVGGELKQVKSLALSTGLPHCCCTFHRHYNNYHKRRLP